MEQLPQLPQQLPNAHLSILPSSNIDPSANHPAHVTKTHEDVSLVSSDSVISDSVLLHTAQGSSPLEKVADAMNEVYKSSFKIAEFELIHLSPISSPDPQQVIHARPRRFYHVLPPLMGQHKNIGYTSFL